MNVYQSNIRKYGEVILESEKVSSRLSAYRLGAFIFSAIIVITLASEGMISGLMVVIPLCVIAFILLIKRHNEVDDLKKQATFFKEINEAEVLRVENKLSGFSAGQEFISRDHPFVADLDVFGKHSLFQLLNRTTTESGSILLADWLSVPSPKNVILERQAAVRELSPRLDWRQSFQAAGMDFTHKKSDYDKLLTWVEEPVRLLPQRTKYLLISILLSIVSTAAAIYFFSHLMLISNGGELIRYLFPLAIMLVINSLVLKRFMRAAEVIIKNIHHNIRILGGYRSLINNIVAEKFDSPVLQRLQAVLRDEDYSAADEINEMKEILEVFKIKGRKGEIHNMSYAALNVLWFLDVYLILLTEKWKSTNGSRLRGWAAAVSEFEVLSSLAGFHYSNPSFTFPQIMPEPYRIKFDMMGHPLIREDKRVCNHFTLNGRGQIAMITGSNMAGKSTFLRTVGVNLVLALMGAPCCANGGQVSNMKIFSSMRTQDNLEEGVSSFYAELKRVGQLLKLIESGEPVFFLLDEMFKGTNSKDRHKGGFSLIKQLEELNAFGIISTHDLELARLAGKHEIVANYSFNSSILDGEMIFDYQLNDGLCRDFNASELMRKNGIKILSQIEEI